MSWLKEMVGGEVMPPFELDDPKVEDPAIPNRMVSTKSANRPFLTYVLTVVFSIEGRQGIES